MSFAEISASWSLLLMRQTPSSMIFRLYSFGAHARKDNMRFLSVGMLFQAVLSFPLLRFTMSRSGILFSSSLPKVDLRQGCRLLVCDVINVSRFRRL